MKMSIEWHENCLENKKKYLNKQAQEIESLTIKIKSERVSYNLHLAQLLLAREENKDGFDSERYGIKRLCV